MNKDDCVRSYCRFANNYMQTFGFWGYSIKNAEDSSLLKRNTKYKDKYKGKRCFVLGNGPSLNQIDFKLLANEYVFTVNELMRHKQFKDLESNFHFIADPEYFKLDQNKVGDRKIIELIKDMSDSTTCPVFFTPIEGKSIVRQYGWLKEEKCAFFSSKLEFFHKFNQDINFAKFVPAFQAVVQWAIAMAVYMGFNEIYLLGCDATNAITDIAAFMERDFDELYAYKLDEYDKRMVVDRHKKRGVEATLRGYNRIFEVFRELNDWCVLKGVKLVNCSGETVIESIPRMSIEEVFKERSLK